MEYKKKLQEIEKIMESIENNKDLDKQMELYEKGKKKCASLEKKINLQKEKIEKMDHEIDDHNGEEDNSDNDENINQILQKIEDIYKKINNEELPIEDIEKFYKQSLILKKKSQKYRNIKDLEIKYL